MCTVRKAKPTRRRELERQRKTVNTAQRETRFDLEEREGETVSEYSTQSGVFYLRSDPKIVASGFTRDESDIGEGEFDDCIERKTRAFYTIEPVPEGERMENCLSRNLRESNVEVGEK